MVKTSVMTVTPEQARVWLERSKTHNRNISEPIVKQMATDMRVGAFVMNGESVIMSESGDILDGHHRLKACVAAGVPFVTVVVTGVQGDVMATIDTGDMRNKVDVLQFGGYKNAGVMSGVTRLVWHAERGTLATMHRSWREVGFTNVEMLTVAKNHPGIADACRVAQNLEKKFQPMSRQLFGFGWYWFGRIDAVLGPQFCEGVADGIGFAGDSPITLFRNRMIEDSVKKSKLPYKHKVALFIKAWRFHANGDSIRVLKWVDTESFPDPDPSI